MRSGQPSPVTSATAIARGASARVMSVCRSKASCCAAAGVPIIDSATAAVIDSTVRLIVVFITFLRAKTLAAREAATRVLSPLRRHEIGAAAVQKRRVVLRGARTRRLVLHRGQHDLIDRHTVL